jgi:hypothetical protein
MDFKSILIGALSTALLFVSLGASNGKTNSINPTPPSLETTESTKDILRLGGAVLDDNGNVWQVCYGKSPYYRGYDSGKVTFWYVKVVNDVYY